MSTRQRLLGVLVAAGLVLLYLFILTRGSLL